MQKVIFSAIMGRENEPSSNEFNDFLFSARSESEDRTHSSEASNLCSFL
jgi:hypothetical protein